MVAASMPPVHLVAVVSVLFSLLNFYVTVGATETPPNPPPFRYLVDVHYYDTVVDHFNFRPTPEATFPLRYFVNDRYLNNTSGPCFFYTGNEADITQFVNHSGSIFEFAEEFGALVVFAEHRYYGTSNPFGYDNALGRGYNISFLTVEQAMEDFNLLTLHIRKKWGLSASSAFVAFGGSYGANLSLWLRLKNPNLWAGAIASSPTPLKHLLRESNAFARIETEVYANTSSRCPELVRDGWRDLYRLAATKAGRVELSESIGLCNVLPDEDSAEDLHGWISDALETMVQYGYPYPTDYYRPVPAYPATVACQDMVLDGTGLGALRSAVAVYYNYTGDAGDCFDFEGGVVTGSGRYWSRKGRHELLELREMRMMERWKKKQGVKSIRKRREDGSVTERRAAATTRDLYKIDNRSTEDRTEKAWSYQTCTEVYQPMPTNGITDFETPYSPNATAYYARCRKLWNVEPRPTWEETTFMGENIGTGSNLFLTNGQLDPWRAAGIQNLPKRSDGSIIIRTMEGAAHHLDLRAANEMDPKSVVLVRKEQRAAIQKWIYEWAEIH